MKFFFILYFYYCAIKKLVIHLFHAKMQRGKEAKTLSRQVLGLITLSLLRLWVIFKQIG
jgi:hypothetical protein